LCLLINVYYPYFCLVKFFPCEQGAHLFFLHQGPFTSLAATGVFDGRYEIKTKAPAIPRSLCRLPGPPLRCCINKHRGFIGPQTSISLVIFFWREHDVVGRNVQIVGRRNGGERIDA